MELKFFNGKECQVAVVEHSINQRTNKEILTYQLRYPRFIHSEFMTHRVFSRNASSSRAVPVKKQIAAVLEQPAFFVWVGVNEPGMQATQEISPELLETFKSEWIELSKIVASYCERWAVDYKIHKQTANRALEPFTYISVVVTSTEWENFFGLRDHKDAQPEIRELATLMKQAKAASKPRMISEGTLGDSRLWHLPYVTMEERKSLGILELLYHSVARCCRVSYLNHDKTTTTIEVDTKLHDDLVTAQPMHASPLEHQAFCTGMISAPSGNLRGGWGQYRAVIQEVGLEGFRTRMNNIIGKRNLPVNHTAQTAAPDPEAPRIVRL